MSETSATPKPPNLADIWRACVRAWRVGVQPVFDREAQLQRLDAMHALRGVASQARRFTPATIAGSGGSLHLEVMAVEARRPTVVFMPGTNAYALLYAEFLAALAERGFNVVAFDPRGHGASGGRRGSYVLRELVDDMDRAVDYARQRFGGPIAVAGSSQGGITAFYYAAAKPQITAAVCHNAADLTHPDHWRLTRIPAVVNRLLAPCLRMMARVVPELPVPMTAYLDLAREPVRGVGNARNVLYADPDLVPFVRLKTLASLSYETLACPVEQFRVPVLLLHAGADTIFPEDSVRRLHSRLPEPKSLLVYPGLPHYLIVDHVPAFIDDVVAWLDAMFRRNAGA